MAMLAPAKMPAAQMEVEIGVAICCHLYCMGEVLKRKQTESLFSQTFAIGSEILQV